MAFIDGRLYVAGLSNEEFASKLRSVAVSVQRDRPRHERRDLPRQPRAARDAVAGLHVRAVHGQRRAAPHRRLPVHAAREVPGRSLKPGAKVRGTTIAELGAGNRPLDMILYKKDGKEFLLMSNNSRGVMKIPTADFAHARRRSPRRSTAETAGVAYETIAAMTGHRAARPARRAALDRHRARGRRRSTCRSSPCREHPRAARRGAGDARRLRRGLQPIGRHASPRPGFTCTHTRDGPCVHRGRRAPQTRRSTRSPIRASRRSSGPQIFHVSVAGDSIQVVGRHEVVDNTIRFTPAFPFDPGRTYNVWFKPGNLPGASPIS